IPLSVCFGILLCVDWGWAQDVPPPDVLKAIVPQLRKKLPGTEVSFQAPIVDTTSNSSCGMQQAQMIVSQGTDHHTFDVLIDPPASLPIAPKQVLARITRLRVDADGSARSYHPEDPDGEGVCKEVSQASGTTTLQGICALDDISNAGIRLFVGSERI